MDFIKKLLGGIYKAATDNNVKYYIDQKEVNGGRIVLRGWI